MKVVILAGGVGSRLSEHTETMPKPMVEIGGRPILWHIMKSYAHYGFREFVIAAGYRAEVLKRYFLDYYSLNGNLTIELGNGQRVVTDQQPEDWTVQIVDTGLRTETGGRLRRLRPWLEDSAFMLTYGDGVADVNLRHLVDYHHTQGRLATLTAVRPPARFGGLTLDGNLVQSFLEKPQIGEGWINGGFMVFEPGVFDYLGGDETSLEYDTLERLAEDAQLAAYRHPDFWQCMDTLRDLRLLEQLIRTGNAPWKVWERARPRD
jgi:glucose-1-phosphate cytidylyltransferase